MRMLNDNEENDTTVSWEDQKAINEFSRLDVVLADARALLTQQRDDKEALDDLIMELELVDEDEKADAERVDTRISELENEADEAEASMKELKVKLYARFGTSINLERD